MFDSIIPFVVKYKAIFIFYAFVIVWLAWKWKKIDVQAKFIFLYRMKWGLKWMDHVGKKYREWIILAGYVATGIGFIGMIFITYVLLKNLIDLMLVPETAAGVSLVLPGISVPGLGILPFWYWLIAIFVIALVHEFAHGVVARAHNIPVKNTGIVFFGPILGAFVEPNEKKLRSQTDIKQYSVLSAGAFVNIAFAFAAVVLLNFGSMPLQESMVDSTGFTFDSFDVGPAEEAGLQTGVIISGINGVETLTFQEFSEELQTARAGDSVTVNTAEGDVGLTLGEHPENPKRGYLGITSIKNEFEVKPEYAEGFNNVMYLSLDWANGFLRWSSY